MASSNTEKLYKVLDAFEKAGKDKKEINKIRRNVEKGNLSLALEQIRKLNSAKAQTNNPPKKRGRKVKKKVEDIVDYDEEEEEDSTEETTENEYSDFDGNGYFEDDGMHSDFDVTE